jgi:hypothetical protein
MLKTRRLVHKDPGEGAADHPGGKKKRENKRYHRKRE